MTARRDSAHSRATKARWEMDIVVAMPVHTEGAGDVTEIKEENKDFFNWLEGFCN